MYYEFYIDQFFVEQLISGYLLLLSASILCRASPQWGRLLLGSLLGAGFTTLLVCIKLPGLYPLAWMIAAAAAFWRRALSKEWRYNLNCTLCLLTATVCFGGVLEALMALLPLPFMAAVCLAFVLICMGLRYLYRRGRQTDNSAVVKLTCEGKSLTLAGLLDTGNQLAEPITGRPVSIADEETLKPLLGPEWEKRQGFCLIPFHSLGTGKGWLRGVTLDEMSVTMRRGSREVRRPVIALYDGKVSAGKEYQVILHPEHAP